MSFNVKQADNDDVRVASAHSGSIKAAILASNF